MPCGSMVHCVPEDDERKDSKLPDVPVSVSVPPTVCVVDAAKVRVSAVVEVLGKVQ